MTEGLDMSLDDIIQKNKNTSYSSRGGGGRTSRGGGGRGHGRSLAGVGVGPTRRVEARVPVRTNPYFLPQAVHVPNMMVGRGVGGELATNSEAGTKLYISNLDYEVTNEDIKVLFSDVGELKRYSVHYDRSGRSKGTAEVVYMRQTDAVSAMKRYNNVQLDGKPMRLELVGVNIVAPLPIPPMQAMHQGLLGNPMGFSRSTQGRIVGRGQDRGVGRGQERGGGGKAHSGSGTEKSRARPQKMSAEDLDADLEKYRLEAMHIN